MAGRPEKFTISYFPHYVRDSKTMFIIENKFGSDGYMFWFKLLELLCNSKGLYFDCNEDDNFEYLCAKTKISSDRSLKILKTLANLEKIDKELWENKKIIWCQSLVDNVSDVFRRRKSDIPEKPLINVNTSVIIVSNNSINVSNNSINDNEKPISAPQSKLNKIKEKNIKDIGIDVSKETSTPEPEIDDPDPFKEPEKPKSDKPKKDSPNKRIKFDRAPDIKDAKFIGITQGDIDVWEKAYPAADLDIEVTKSIAWIYGAGAKGYKSKWYSFLNGWFSRCQDRGGTKNGRI